MAHRRSSRKKLNPTQYIKGLIIRARLARKVKQRDGEVVFRLLWGRIAGVMAAMMVMGWISLAGAAYFFVKHARNFPEVRYVDLVFPHRWDHYRVARGDYYIAQGKANLEAGDYRNVLHLIRVGVQLSPTNPDGRIILAGIYGQLGRPDRSIQLLQDRIEENAANKDYITALINALFATHRDDEVDQLATRFLDGDKTPNEHNLMLALAGATANFNRGNYDRAQQFIDDYKLLNARTGRILQARIDWETGEKASAIRRLEQLVQTPGPRQEEASHFLTEYLWLNGEMDRALRIVLLQFASDPLNHEPRIRLLSLHHAMGDTAKRDEEIETFLRLFAREEAALNSMADFAARTANVALAERVHSLIGEQKMALENASVRLIEAHVSAGQYRAALDFQQRIDRSLRDWPRLQQNRLLPLVATAHFGLGNHERGDIVVRELLGQTEVATAELMQFAQRLISIEEKARAREILLHVYTAQPLNQEALGRLIRLDIATGHQSTDLVRNINALLKTRKPPALVLEEAHRHISSDIFLFQQGRSETLSSLETALVSSAL